MRVIILENVRSLHNVGSLLRSADGAGFQKVYFCGYTGHPPDRRIEKVSLGAENFLEWEKKDDPVSLCNKLKSENFELVAIEQTLKSKKLFDAKFKRRKTALILGNEVYGVSPEVLALCDRCLQIPMYGKKSSLNVSVAGGIAMYELARKQK